MAYATAFIAVLVTTSVFLLYSHGRHPFHDLRAKAVWWWAGLVALDVGVAVIILAIDATVGAADQLNEVGGAARGLVVGVLGPLSLRSPVREAEVRGRSEPVGFTYVYDWARIRLDDGLDDRISVLRRTDRKKLEVEITTQGWDEVSVLAGMDEHLDDAKRLRVEDRKQIREAMRLVFTIPPQGRLQALLKIALDERFRALIDQFKSTQPSEAERRRGRELRRRYLASIAEEAKRKREQGSG